MLGVPEDKLRNRRYRDFGDDGPVVVRSNSCHKILDYCVWDAADDAVGLIESHLEISRTDRIDVQRERSLAGEFEVPVRPTHGHLAERRGSGDSNPDRFLSVKASE